MVMLHTTQTLLLARTQNKIYKNNCWGVYTPTGYQKEKEL